MKQNQFIDSLMKGYEEKKSISLSVQAYYEKYLENEKQVYIDQIINGLDTLCRPVVRKTLFDSRLLDEENEHTVMQEAALAVWNTIINDKIKKEKKKNFPGYAFSIYKNQANNLVRALIRKNKKVPIGFSFDDPIDENGTTIGNVFALSDDKEHGFDEGINTVYSELIYVYCYAFTSGKDYPPKNLALYYARVLPHLKEEIPTSKATSAKWAQNYIGDKTVGELKNDSEEYMQTHVDSRLYWGESFNAQLVEQIEINGHFEMLKGQKYNHTFSRAKIEDWADYQHKVTLRNASKIIAKNPELLEKVEDYISKKDVIFKFITGGKNK